MNSIEDNEFLDFLYQNMFKDKRSSEILKKYNETHTTEISTRAFGMYLSKLFEKNIMKRRILKGLYLYTVSPRPPAPPAPEPSLTIQNETPVVSNTVQFSGPYDTPYEPDKKYADFEDKLDRAYQTIDDYKSLVCKMFNFMKRTANTDNETLMLLADIKRQFYG
jgi:hypothetical protein